MRHDVNYLLHSPPARVIGTIFIPRTFLAGVHGINMPIPEIESALAYPLFWLACIAVAVGMGLWFRRRGWL
jgi:magnesium transporter